MRRFLWVLFFFQAEDGIRDYKVTGVQTCALPIFSVQRPFRFRTPTTRSRPSAAPESGAASVSQGSDVSVVVTAPQATARPRGIASSTGGASVAELVITSRRDSR